MAIGEIIKITLKLSTIPLSRFHISSYTPLFLVQYTANGKPYKNWQMLPDRRYFKDGHSAEYAMLQHGYAMGRKVSVYYDPQDPSISILQTGRLQWETTPFIVALFLFLSAVMIWFFLKEETNSVAGAFDDRNFSLAIPSRIRLWELGLILGIAFGGPLLCSFFSLGGAVRSYDPKTAHLEISYFIFSEVMGLIS